MVSVDIANEDYLIGIVMERVMILEAATSSNSVD